METGFKRVQEAVSKYRKQLRTRTSDLQLDRTIQELKAESIKFSRLSVTPSERSDFLESHLGSVFRIYDTLVGDYAKLYVDKHMIVDKLRGICDVIMSTLGIRQPMKRFATVPAVLLADLIRGITHFSTDTDVGWPKYHHNKSCGSPQLTVADKFMISATDTKSNVTHKKSALQKCYIDRLIYDRIYHHVLHRQEIRHLQELKKVENLWQEYHPGSRIEVDVGYDEDTGIPNIVSISYQHSKNMLVHEIYQQLGESVMCERTEYKLTPRRSPYMLVNYKKKQTFQTERKSMEDVDV